MGKYTCQRPIHPGELLKAQTVASQTCCTGGNFVQDFKRYSELPPSSDHFHRVAARSGFRDRCRTADAYAVGLQHAADPK